MQLLLRLVLSLNLIVSLTSCSTFVPTYSDKHGYLCSVRPSVDVGDMLYIRTREDFASSYVFINLNCEERENEVRCR
jgi:hypothetical protein